MFGNFQNGPLVKIVWFATGLTLVFPLFAEKSLHQRIDDLVKAKAGKAPFAESADDTSFLRRVSLDLSGNIPTAGEVTAFLADKNSNKRAKLIDRLISGDSFAGHWTERLSVMLLERLGGGKVTTAEWESFLRQGPTHATSCGCAEHRRAPRHDHCLGQSRCHRCLGLGGLREFAKRTRRELRDRGGRRPVRRTSIDPARDGARW